MLYVYGCTFNLLFAFFLSIKFAKLKKVEEQEPARVVETID